MYQCQYCGRYLKNAYNNCPGCGSNKFERKNNNGIIKITNIPEGGYKINTDNLKKDRFIGIFLIIFGSIWISISLGSSLIFISANTFIGRQTGESFFGYISSIISIPFIIIGAVIIFFGIKAIKKNKEKVKKAEKLVKTGVLIKNLPYEIEPSNTSVNGVPIYCIKVIYEHENGTQIPLISEKKYNGKLSRDDGTVDLLIDPNDISNYFIDFEIY